MADDAVGSRGGPFAPAVAARDESCDVCGGPTFERHCKVICRRCGYTRDCSDP